MKTFLDNMRGLVPAMALFFSLGAMAQTVADEPVITLHSNIYETYGESNQFTILLGTTETVYIDVDCGNGKEEYEASPVYYNEDEGGIAGGALISCKVKPDGEVKIYCEDPLLIDYINADGCYLTDIDLTKLTNLNVLSLCHNELKSLDLTPLTKIQALYLSDNPFTQATPCVIGDKPDLTLLEVTIIDWFDPGFDMTKYPKLQAFDAYHNPTLSQADPTQCPDLRQLTLEMTSVSEVDVTKNPELVILNVSESRCSKIDVSQNPKLRELYCAHNSGTYNSDVKFETLDVSNNPQLIRLICNGNRLTTLDVTNNPLLQALYAQDNLLTELDLTKNVYLQQVYIERNYLDFATLPMDTMGYSDYRYAPRAMRTERSYKEGTVLDFSGNILRDGAPDTEVAVYWTAPTEPDNWQELSTSYYTYADGKLTLLKAYSDSLLVAFANAAFPTANLHTEKFMVKTEEDYGKPTTMITFSAPYGISSFSVGILGATADNPKEFYVSAPGMDQITCQATTQGLPDAANVNVPISRYPVEILLPEGSIVTAIGIKDAYIATIDLSKAMLLEEVSLVNTDLYSINLQNNYNLKSLTVSGNSNLKTLSLAGANQLLNKNILHYIDLSDNDLEELTLNDLLTIHYLDISGNRLSGIDFSDADYMEYFDASDNLFTDMKFQYCSALKTLKASGNLLESILLPTENNIEYMAIDNNCFTLTTLPRHGQLQESNYIYAPQAKLPIATKGPCTDLSEQYIDINGAFTQYVWKDAQGNTLKEGTDYTIENGFTRFVNTEAGMIHCEMSHPAYPAFAGDNIFRTTDIEAAGMPDNMIASFVTTEDGNTVQLSLAAETKGTALYIDWEGNDNVIQYVLDKEYKLFQATTHKGANVKVYTYEPEEHITVFSVSGAKMSSFDGSKLTDAQTLSVTGAGLTNITLPEEKTNLTQLNLTDNYFTAIDLSEYTALEWLYINANHLTSIDLSRNPNLQVVGLAYNYLKEVTFGNPKLEAIDLTQNDLEEISLAGAPNLRQLQIGDNFLTHIDVSMLNQLIALKLSGNYFTFATLPPVKSTYAFYEYQNQRPINVQLSENYQIDLSSQAVINGVETSYAWYIGDIAYNSETDEVEGEQLIEDTEYTLENGVTTFLRSFTDAICVMRNTEFPNLLLHTEYIDVPVVDAVENVAGQETFTVKVIGHDIFVEAESGNTVALYSTTGALLRTQRLTDGKASFANVEQGAYLITLDGTACKAIVQ